MEINLIKAGRRTKTRGGQSEGQRSDKMRRTFGRRQMR